MINEWTFAANVGCALGLGAAIGLERQWRQHPAGLRTNTLVAVGAAVFVSLELLIGREVSPTRVAAQVASGVGFLGGGVILREGLTVRGMNTAATLWCSAAVGALAGSGFRLPAAIATAGILFVLIALRPVVRLMEARLHGMPDTDTYYRLRVSCPPEQGAVIRAVLLRHVGSQPHMSLSGISTQAEEEKDEMAIIATARATERNDRFMEEMVSRLSIEPGVTAVSWEKVVG
jgi:putative Mg2+ transporter-C (MgtC) family protein